MVAKYEFSIFILHMHMQVGCNMGRLYTLYKFIYSDWSIRGQVRLALNSLPELWVSIL